jgi:FlaA1/EpsC-like NDP-sugar epimerase
MSQKDEKTKFSFIMELNNFLERTVTFLIPVRTGLVFISSLFTVILSFLLAFYFRHDFTFSVPESEYITKVIYFVIAVKLIVFFIFRLYEGMWRFVSISDIIRIFTANFISSAIIITGLYFFRASYAPGFSLNVVVIDFLICFFAMCGKRIVTRIIREAASKASGQQDIRTILVGKSDNLNQLIQAFSANPSKRRIIGVLADDLKTGHSLRGVTILGKPYSAAKCAKKHNASEILLLPPYSTPSNIKKILNDLEERNKSCDLRMIPSYMDIAEGDINISHIKEVEIEDLLGRKPVQMNRDDVAQFVKGRTIMISGAGGSIGSELCIQLAAYQPEKLILFELSEYNLYEISNRLNDKYQNLNIVSIIGDDREKNDIKQALEANKVQVIFHAAALKHVPLMEANPAMAVRTNVFGSVNIADMAEKCSVERMVMISTDKAVNPTSVMGATKRLAERIILERPKGKTDFVVVRFGNVLGSSGSVIPRFKEQLRSGGPLTVTSKEVVRYFMSIPEAVDLLLQAAVIGNDRDIMVLAMGEQINIYEMAKKLIELSGLEPDVDIKIKITGLRPGEKKYEELLTDEEKVDCTPYDRIYVAKKLKTSATEISLEHLKNLLNEKDPRHLKNEISIYIPENKFDSAS